jgi:hypothetical protein
MKLTKSALKQIIKEETQKTLNEALGGARPPATVADLEKQLKMYQARYRNVAKLVGQAAASKGPGSKNKANKLRAQTEKIRNKMIMINKEIKDAKHSQTQAGMKPAGRPWKEREAWIAKQRKERGMKPAATAAAPEEGQAPMTSPDGRSIGAGDWDAEHSQTQAGNEDILGLEADGMTTGRRRRAINDAFKKGKIDKDEWRRLRRKYHRSRKKKSSPMEKLQRRMKKKYGTTKKSKPKVGSGAGSLNPDGTIKGSGSGYYS